ncbi:MAG: NUDIX domain-containing protein [Caldisericia bacterium]|nr:NUDIX domain-containing protein [Caldisericia bacterium]MDD4614080.1 NUDIX domain-containing protein [Caldisericia bacterium]
MRFEKSCGTIIYRHEHKRILYLIVRYRLHSRYWGLIKGHVENQESEIQTARREIYEEVGFQDIRFIPGFRETICYCPFPDCVKDVVFFLGTTHEQNVRFICNEHDHSKWLPETEARNYLKHGNDRFVIHRAELFIRNLLS